MPASAFADARGRFATDEEFVNRIACHLQFRAQFDFLPSDPGHVADMMSRPGHPEAMRELGLGLSSAEWAEFERRQDLIDHIVPIKRFLTGRAFDEVEEEKELDGRIPTGSLFAGIWQDHRDGGKLKVAVTDVGGVDRSRLARLFPGAAAELVFIQQPYSADDLYRWKDEVILRMKEAGTATFASAAGDGPVSGA